MGVPNICNLVWAYDFFQGRTHNGSASQVLSVVGESVREWPEIKVDLKQKSPDVTKKFAGLFPERGMPDYIRPDSGAGFTNMRARKRLERLRAPCDFWGSC